MVQSRGFESPFVHQHRAVNGYLFIPGPDKDDERKKEALPLSYTMPKIHCSY